MKLHKIWILFGLCLMLSQCKQSDEDNMPSTLVDYLKGKTWQLGTVSQNSTEVSEDFAGFQISFNADGSAGQITTGGTTSETLAVNYTYAGNNMMLSPVPSAWSATLSNVVATETSLSFSVSIESTKTGSLTYVFALIPL